MPVKDKWSQYAAPAPADRWAQYATPANDANHPAGLPAGMSLPGVPPPANPITSAPAPAYDAFKASHPIMAGALDTVGDLGKGFVKGAAGTVANIDNMAAKIPGVGNFLTTPLVGNTTSEQARANLAARAVPTNTAQTIGKGAEQAAEFLVPGGAEEGMIAGLGANTAERMAIKGVGAGLVNKAQGGSFLGGAAGGAAGEGVAAAAKAAAPSLAELAMKVGFRDRVQAPNFGKTLLDETTGFSPAKIAATTNDTVSGLNDERNALVNNSSNFVDLRPAQDTARSFYDSALARNEQGTIRDMDKLVDQVRVRAPEPGLPAKPVTVPLTNPETSGWGGPTLRSATRTVQPLPVQIPPVTNPGDALRLKQGLGDLESNWKALPGTTGFTQDAVRATYGALDNAVDSAVPGSAELNSKMSRLIPIADKAAQVDLQAGTIQRTLARLGAHTGALVAGGAGADAGYRAGGVPGAVIGGVTGLVAPELLANPSAQMAAARAAYSPALSRYAIPALQGLVAQPLRGK